MTPTPENIADVAHARIGAIRARARELGDTESDDTRLLDIVIRRAVELTERRHGPSTAQAAVAWSIADMYAIDAPTEADT